MNHKTFDKIVDRRLSLIKEVLSNKAKEYMQEDDRLYNFKRAGKINNVSPEKALWGMSTKHLVSVIDLVEGADKIKIPSPDLIEEKIGDMINYLILLEAMLKRNVLSISNVDADRRPK